MAVQVHIGFDVRCVNRMKLFAKLPDVPLFQTD